MLWRGHFTVTQFLAFLAIISQNWYKQFLANFQEVFDRY